MVIQAHRSCLEPEGGKTQGVGRENASLELKEFTPGSLHGDRKGSPCRGQQNSRVSAGPSAQKAALGSTARAVLPAQMSTLLDHHACPSLLGNTCRLNFLKIGHTGHYGRVFNVSVSKKILTLEVLRERSYEILNIL